MNCQLKTLSICAVLAGFAAPVQADKTLSYVPEPGSAGEPMTILVKPPKVRMETSDFAFLYDAVADQTIVMNLNERTYYRMTRERAEALANQMQAAQQQMQEMMEQAKANMSEEQRAQLEQYMASSGMGGLQQPPKMSIKKTGRQGEFYNTECEWVEMVNNGQALSEMCIADTADLDMEASEREAVNKMAELLLSMGSRLSRTALEHRPDGIPIAMNDLEENQRLRLDGLSDEALDGSLFELPADFELMSVGPGG